MPTKRKGVASPPRGAPSPTDWETYNISGSGSDVTYSWEYNDGVINTYSQLWYQSDTVSRRCLQTVPGSSGNYDVLSPDARVGPNSLAWIVALDKNGETIETGTQVDVTD